MMVVMMVAVMEASLAALLVAYWVDLHCYNEDQVDGRN